MIRLLKRIIKLLLYVPVHVINYIDLFAYRCKNHNNDITIISRDCVGGVLYNQLGLKFLTPTINLFFSPNDFIVFVKYLNCYLYGEFNELKMDTNYPVALLTPKRGSEINIPVTIHFMHYSSYSDAIKKWNERKQRINWQNIFIVSTFCYPLETSTLSEQMISDWNDINYKKVILVDKEYGFQNECIVKKHPSCKEPAWLLYTPSKIILWKKTFNVFDFIKFFNEPID